MLRVFETAGPPQQKIGQPDDGTLAMYFGFLPNKLGGLDGRHLFVWIRLVTGIHFLSAR
jgi:hypothetical protein